MSVIHHNALNAADKAKVLSEIPTATAALESRSIWSVWSIPRSIAKETATISRKLLGIGRTEAEAWAIAANKLQPTSA